MAHVLFRQIGIDIKQIHAEMTSSNVKTVKHKIARLVSMLSDQFFQRKDA